MSSPTYSADHASKKAKYRTAERLSRAPGVDFSQPIHFRFNGKPYTGYAGDTLASALLANNVRVVARSFKYHRPRGIFSAGSEEPNALVQLEKGAHTLPNARATEIELYEGLQAFSQNCWPSVNLDIGAINNLLSKLFPAGFYYKTFMWPKRLWMKYEEVIRHSAGLGKSPNEPDPSHYLHQHHYCDVLVVGGGPAGLAAALAASGAGASVTLIDENPKLGGALWGDNAEIDHQPALEWVAKMAAQLSEREAVRVFTRTTVTGSYHHNYLVAVQRVTNHLGPNAAAGIPREVLWKIRAKKVVLATGAIERPLVFADNDRPGVMLASAFRRYLTQFGVLPGQRLVVLTNNDSAYALAVDADAAGAKVTVIDTRQDVPEACQTLAAEAGFDIRENHSITATEYRKGLKGVQVAEMNDDGSGIISEPQHIDADHVAVSGGWTPTLHLYSQAGGKLVFDPAQQCFLPDLTQPGRPDMLFAGSCAGAFDLPACLRSGGEAGTQAAVEAGWIAVERVEPPTASPTMTGISPDTPRALPCDHPIGKGRKKHFHELHNDATIADIALAEREGFISVEHLKRYTTTGMGTDQGKTSNVNALTEMAALRGKPVSEVGTTTFRPPYTPLTFGAIVGQNCGELFLQKRTTAMHLWHEQNGAVFEDVGDWKRPWYFPRAGEDMHAAVQRECLAARSGVGILDASTLGKIDIQGKDAAKFLNMVYTNAWLKLGVHKCRYGLMLNEHGMVFDDGVTTRLGENHFHMTTTTGGAARVMSWLEEFLQTEWPEWEVYCTSVTEQWAVMALNGPRSRDLLAELTDADLSAQAFPFMSMIEAEVAGVPARIFRISFTGELAFEINVPARYGQHVWEALVEVGEQYALTPYGTEAMHVLRAEKGFIICGQDTDGSVTPYDLGMGWIVGEKKRDFLGKRSLSRSDTARDGRKQLVGLRTEDPDFVIPEGAHVIKNPLAKTPVLGERIAILGHVSSSYMSPNVGRSIAMALVKDGRNRMGDTLHVAMMDGSSQPVTVTEPVFFDPDGERAKS